MPQDKSLKELEAKIAAKQTRLHNLTQATQVAQDEWDDRKKQIASDTKVQIGVTKAGIKNALLSEQTELDTLKSQVTANKQAESERHELVETRITKLVSKGDELERANKVLQTTNATLSEDNRNLTSQITVSRETIAELQAKETTLSSKLVDLGVETQTKGEELEALNTQFSDKTTELSQLEERFTIVKTDTEREIQVLESKRQATIQEILDNKAQDDKVRENLADWAKKLQKQDDNLRTREAQVNIQQQAIARNANLLNL